MTQCGKEVVKPLISKQFWSRTRHCLSVQRGIEPYIRGGLHRQFFAPQSQVFLVSSLSQRSTHPLATMPMHRIFYPINALSVEDKKQLAERITELYVSGKCEGLTVPPFYVQVIFTPIDKDSLFVGGKVTDKCVRIHMYHREDQLKTKESKKKFLEMYEMVLAPFIKERGLDWEVSGEFCPPHMLRMNGVPQPLPGSPAEKEWMKTNKVAPFQGPSILDLAA